MKTRTNKKNLASWISLVSGIFSVFPWLCLQIWVWKFPPSPIEGYAYETMGVCSIVIPASVLAIIKGIVSLKQINKSGEAGKWMAISGIILGILGLLPIFCRAVTGILAS